MWYVILNPAAGGGAAGRLWPRLEEMLQTMGFSYTVQHTESKGHAIRLAETAVLKGYRHILGVGGDGTNHEIVNGILMQTQVPSAEVSYALLPVGTGNDWARTYGLSHDPRRRLEALLSPKTVLQDVGVLRYQQDGAQQTRFFVNVAGLAYDAYVARRIGERSKPLYSRLHYLALVGQYLWDYRLTKARIQVAEAPPVEDRFYTVNIGICRYSGGGMQLVPHAVPDDGLLALTYARSVSKATVLMITPRFYNGTLLSHPRVEGLQTRRVVIEAMDEGPTWLEADGEFLGETPVEVSLLEKALKVVL